MLFSIIIPTYNRAHLIGKTISSLLNQNYPGFELIIVDDGSTDQTEELIRGLDDPRIKYYKKENGGVSSARNYGLAFCSGDFINFFDSDDLAYPNHLQEAFNFISADSSTKILMFDFEWGNAERTNVKEVLMRYENPNEAILSSNFPSTNCVFLHKSVFKEVRFNESLTIAEDWEFWLKHSVRHKFFLGKIKTSYFIDHSGRSVRNFNLANLLNQKKLLIDSLSRDELFYRTNKSRIYKINAHMLSYIAIHGALEGEKISVMALFLRSIFLDPQSLLTKRTLAILKHLLFTW